MIVDTSALIAIVIDASRAPIAGRHVDDLVAKARLAIEPGTADQAVGSE